MSTSRIIDSEFATLVYHHDEKIVHHQFHKPVDTEHLRLVLNTVIDLLREHGATKWLSDNRAIDPHSEDDGIWINEDWAPRVLAAGWKYWALVVPDNIKARMDMSQFVTFFYDKGVRVMVSDDVVKAKTWLERVDRE